jgi:prepilin-type N-terminal cleavage/methylation domain-containing protein
MQSFLLNLPKNVVPGSFTPAQRRTFINNIALRNQRKGTMKHQKGFTLIEVIVAIAVVAQA